MVGKSRQDPPLTHAGPQLAIDGCTRRQSYWVNVDWISYPCQSYSPKAHWISYRVLGYNTSFSAAAERAAQLAYDLAFPGPTVLFSWPSDGDVLAYTRDEEKARTAWRQMAEVLDHLTRLGPGVPVYVVAHSMGNRVLTQGLAELLRQRPGADRAFRQVVLASPDIGEEEFRQRWVHELNSANAPRFTLYASKQDVPVALSAWLHGEPRLGSGGTGIVVLPSLDSIDASAITKEWFGLSHS